MTSRLTSYSKFFGGNSLSLPRQAFEKEKTSGVECRLKASHYIVQNLYYLIRLDYFFIRLNVSAMKGQANYS